MSLLNGNATTRDLEKMEERLTEKLIWAGIFICCGTVLLGCMTVKTAQILYR